MDVGGHALVGPARRSKVDDLDAAALGVPQQDVLGLQIAVDDVDLRLREEGQSLEDLLGEFADEVEGNAAELCILQELVQIERQHLKDQALMTSVDKVRQETDAAVLVPPVVLDEMDQKVDLRFGLDEEGFLALDDLDGHFRLSLGVHRLDDLPERSLAYSSLESIAIVVY